MSYKRIYNAICKMSNKVLLEREYVAYNSINKTYCYCAVGALKPQLAKKTMTNEICKAAVSFNINSKNANISAFADKVIKQYNCTLYELSRLQTENDEYIGSASGRYQHIKDWLEYQVFLENQA